MRQNGGTIHWNATTNKYNEGKEEVYDTPEGILAFKSTNDFKYAFHEHRALTKLGVTPREDYIAIFTGTSPPKTICG